jgi:hypothetical protein
MKIVAHLHAMITILSPWDELRPVSGAAFPATMELLKKRYQFQQGSQSAISQQAGLITPNLMNGQFKFGELPVAVNQFEFQPAAVAAACSTTEQTDAFLEDAFQFLSDSLGYRAPPKDRERHDVTTIIVDFENPFSALFERWKKIQALLNKLAGKGPELEPYAVRFMAGPPNQPIAERQYVLERRIGAPDDANWYFSQAPLDTASHVKLLEGIAAELK